MFVEIALIRRRLIGDEYKKASAPIPRLSGD